MAVINRIKIRYALIPVRDPLETLLNKGKISNNINNNNSNDSNNSNNINNNNNNDSENNNDSKYKNSNISKKDNKSFINANRDKSCD